MFSALRGYRGSCRCPPSSWRKCLRAWTGRAPASSPLQSSTQASVSCTPLGVTLLHLGQVEAVVSVCSLKVTGGTLPSKTTNSFATFTRCFQLARGLSPPAGPGWFFSSSSRIHCWTKAFIFVVCGKNVFFGSREFCCSTSRGH